MRLFATRALFFLLSTAAIAGCSKSPTISIPPPPPPRMYMADLNTGLLAFSQPVGATSTPLFSLISGTQDSGLAVDSTGRLFVSHYTTSTIDVYTQPITATSIPSFTIGPVAIGNISGITIDSHGNLWGASEFSHELFMIAPPFAAGPITPTYFQSASFAGPVDVAFDLAGDILVPQYSGSNLLVFRAPFAFPGPNVPAAIITLPTNAAGLGIDTHDHLIIGLDDGRLAILNPPFATGNTPAAFIAAPIINGGPTSEPLHSAFDATGNLYVPYGAHGSATAGLGVYAPPFGGSSAPIFVLNAGMSFPFGVAFAQ